MKILSWLWAVPLAIILPTAAEANTVPNFTRGTMTSHTESSTTVTETYKIVEYSTATSYTMSSRNITWTGTPGLNTGYSQVIPGCTTQFSETYLGPGIASVTDLTRTTTTTSFTDSISVFTQ